MSMPFRSPLFQRASFSASGACRRSFLLGLLMLAGSAGTALAGPVPEDLLKGQVIISDSSLPTRWTSAAAYAAQLKKMHKKSLTYDKKTGKVQVYYAAFFEKAVNDVQVNFVIYDITGGAKARKGAWEAFLGGKGQRVLFNSVELDKEDLEMNKQYRFVIESKGKPIAYADVKLLGEAPKYSGKVEFSEEEAKKRE